ncbi:MAG: SCO family protein [Planctomycetes bacterium]|nr:SCO family protein [Planctomycetota bacterium]
MSDSFSSETSARANSTPAPTNGSPSVLRWFFVINGLFCFVLIGAWVAFGMRGRGDSDNAGLNPFARGKDTIEEEDDNNGRPKVVKIEMKWSENGIADFELTERDGRVVHKSDLEGHPWVVSFIFTNCAGPCAKVSSAMQRLQKEFFAETDLRLVTITVDPERDQPEQLSKYADGYEADPDRWLFLTDPTGKKDKIYPMINGSFLMRVEEATGAMREPGYEFIHTNNVLLVDERGVVQGKWLSTDEAEFSQLRRELKKRLKKITKDETPTDERKSKPE